MKACRWLWEGRPLLVHRAFAHDGDVAVLRGKSYEWGLGF